MSRASSNVTEGAKTANVLFVLVFLIQIRACPSPAPIRYLCVECMPISSVVKRHTLCLRREKQRRMGVSAVDGPCPIGRIATLEGSSNNLLEDLLEAPWTDA